MLIAAFQMAADISIHAPREGGDVHIAVKVPPDHISIHAPREGGDRDTARAMSILKAHFNPRPPRGGRLVSTNSRTQLINFNPRPPRGGRLLTAAKNAIAERQFQSTPPARGATGRKLYHEGRQYHFNPRPPRGGRHADKVVYGADTDISIHAPREGGDAVSPRQPHKMPFISIHAPREGGDRDIPRSAVPHTHFNPRPPRGGRLHHFAASF